MLPCAKRNSFFRQPKRAGAKFQDFQGREQHVALQKDAATHLQIFDWGRFCCVRWLRWWFQARASLDPGCSRGFLFVFLFSFCLETQAAWRIDVVLLAAGFPKVHYHISVWLSTTSSFLNLIEGAVFWWSTRLFGFDMWEPSRNRTIPDAIKSYGLNLPRGPVFELFCGEPRIRRKSSLRKMSLCCRSCWYGAETDTKLKISQNIFRGSATQSLRSKKPDSFQLSGEKRIQPATHRRTAFAFLSTT